MIINDRKNMKIGKLYNLKSRDIEKYANTNMEAQIVD